MISVVIPFYNCKKHLPACLKSLAGQSMPDFEAIVVDNGSNDGSSGIARAFCENDGRFKYVRCEARGVSNARNAGLELADGKYVFFLDGDDLLHSDALRTLYSVSAGADITACAVRRFSRRTPALNKTLQGAELYEASSGGEIARLFRRSLNPYDMYNVFKLYKTSFLRQRGLKFNPELSLGEDLLFNLEAYRRAERVVYVKSPLYMYRVTRGGLNSRERSDLAEIKLMLHGEMKAYLAEYGLLDREYYAIAFNELFALVMNERKAPGGRRRSAHKINANTFSRVKISSNFLYSKKPPILSSDFAREILLENSPFARLSPLKKAAFIYLKALRRNT